MKRPIPRKNNVQTAERRPQPADSSSMVDLRLTVSHQTLRSVPTPVKVALKKLAVFKMQTQIDEDLKAGDIKRATQRLQIMATRLLDLGQNGLAQAALQEAK